MRLETHARAPTQSLLGAVVPEPPSRRRAQGRSPTCLRCAQSGWAGSDRARQGRSIGVGAGEKAVRAPDSASSSGPEGGAAASSRAALYPGEEAPRRRPVTPGPAGPSGLPPRHSHAPVRRPTIATDLPADRHRRPEQASERPLPPRAGQQQASARSGPTRLNGPLQPPGSGARTAIRGFTRRSVLSYAPTGCGACPSSSPPCEHAFPAGAHWPRPPPAPPQVAAGVPRRSLRTSEVWAGPGGGARGWRSARRGLGAVSGFSQTRTSVLQSPPDPLGPSSRGQCFHP